MCNTISIRFANAGPEAVSVDSVLGGQSGCVGWSERLPLETTDRRGIETFQWLYYTDGMIIRNGVMQTRNTCAFTLQCARL